MISVIVPVYNVKPYLEQCLESLLAQSFRDIELIVVDDGSTDGSGEIADRYGKTDGRIRVFHTENRGLSAARNLGLDEARGEWLMFVDPDDWVEPGFCEIPYNAAMENGADLVIFDRAVIGADGARSGDKIGVYGIVSAQKAVGCGRPAAWNKLYKSALFDGIRFPAGRFFEDIATTHKLVYRAERVVILEDALYNYRKREGSISDRKDERVYRDLYLSRLERYEDLLSFGHPREPLEKRMLIHSLLFLMRVKPSDDPLYRRADVFVSSWQGDPALLKPHERKALTIWRLDKTSFFDLYRNAKAKDRSEN